MTNPFDPSAFPAGRSWQEFRNAGIQRHLIFAETGNPDVSRGRSGFDECVDRERSPEIMLVQPRGCRTSEVASRPPASTRRAPLSAPERIGFVMSGTRPGVSVPAQPWPSKLWLVRHGESAGNVARDAAHAARSEDIEIDARDVDVPLSELGHNQAAALAHWFASMDPEDRPEVILSSPYLRARDTANAVTEAIKRGSIPETVADERLREREFGIVDRLTRLGIEQRHPDLAAARRLMGKFYFRPPGGESWCDVILRLRGLLDSVSLHYSNKRVLIVSHQVVVLCFRYLIEKLDEASLLAIDAEGDVANCSVTEYALKKTHENDTDLQLERYNLILPLLEQGAPVTTAPDAKVAAR